MFRFTIRQLLLGVSLVAALLGGLVWFQRAQAKAHHDAVKAAYLRGWLTVQEARERVGTEVDSWPPPKQP